MSGFFKVDAANPKIKQSIYNHTKLTLLSVNDRGEIVRFSIE